MGTVATVADLEALERNLADGQTLPSSWYVDRDVFALESKVVLRRAWHYGAHIGELAVAGDQLPIEVAGVPIVLVHTPSGDIDGFVNICRHRAHAVVLQPRNRKAMTCSYHGWSYGLDGALKHAPRSEYEPHFDASRCGLARVQVARWGPTIWVNPDLSAPSFTDWTRGLAEAVAANGIDVDQHSFAFGRDWEINANWKVFVDNAIECYHCPVAHPSLSRIIDTDPRTQELIVGGRNWTSHRTPLRRSALNPLGDKVYFFHWIWPTTYFQYAGSGFDIGSVQVVGPDRIVFRSRTFVPGTISAEDLRARIERLEADPTIPEDIAICERVQHAHASEALDTGYLIPGSEVLVQHFQRVLVDTIKAAGNRP